MQPVPSAGEFWGMTLTDPNLILGIKKLEWLPRRVGTVITSGRSTYTALQYLCVLGRLQKSLKLPFWIQKPVLFARVSGIPYNFLFNNIQCKFLRMMATVSLALQVLWHLLLLRPLLFDHWIKRDLDTAHPKDVENIMMEKCILPSCPLSLRIHNYFLQWHTCVKFF